MTSPWPRNPLLAALAAVWSLPFGLLGLLLALVLRPWSVQEWREGACDIVIKDGKIVRWFRARKWRAFTLGWTILFWGLECYDTRTRNHERRHVWHWLVLGPLMPPGYLGLLAKCGYEAHPLERDAVTYALLQEAQTQKVGRA